jgi:Dolichyl-phosphate-mannose-protein mannosyltransferase
VRPEAARRTETRDRPDNLRWVVAVASSLALAIVLTWPWAVELWRGRVFGDAGQFTWNAWWVAHQVLSLHNPWWTDYQYAPVGAYLTAHTLDMLPFALLAPLTAAIGPIPVYGLVIIGLHAAAAVLMWRLALAMGLGDVGAATAGLLWASSPIVVFKATAHVHQLVLIASLPATFLLWRRLVRTERIRDGILLGAFLGAGLLTDIPVAAYSLLALGAAEAYLLSGSGLTRLRRRVPALLAGAATFLVVGLPLWVTTIRAESSGHYGATQGDRVGSARSFNADVAQFLLPSPFSRFLDGTYRRAADRLGSLSDFNVDTPVSLGYATLALALVGLVATRGSRRTRWLAASVAVCAVLSLGPTLKLAGHVYRPVPVHREEVFSAILPGTWLTAVPVLRDLRIPPRFMLLGAFAVVLLAGLGARAAVSRQGRIGVAAVVSLCAVAVAEGAVTMEGDADPDAKRIARLIADDPRNGVVVDVPLAWADGFSSMGYAPAVGRPLLQQTIHEKPIASGYISRIDRSRYDVLLEHPLYRAMLLLQDAGRTAPDVPSPSEAAVRADAERLNARWVVVWPEADRGVLPLLRRVGYRQVAASPNGVLLYTRA